MFTLFVCTSVVGASWLWTRTVGPLLKQIDPFYGKEIFVRLEIETMKCKMMHDAMQKIDTHFLYRRTYKSKFVNIIIENFID